MGRDLPFLKAIAAAPGDALPRLIFADWLDEQGRDAEAAGQRWAARHGKYPNGDGIGWYGRFSYRASKHNNLPAAFWIGFFSGAADPLYDGSGSAVDEEQRFLSRCAKLTWAADGEPAGVAPEVPCATA